MSAVTLAILVAIIAFPAVLLTDYIGRRAQTLGGAPLPFFRRWLIPLPVFALIGINWLDILNCTAWVDLHGTGWRGQPARYGDMRVWDTDWIFGFILLHILLLPFMLCGWGRAGWRLAPRVWLGHFGFAWVYGVFLLTTGIPLRD